MIKKIKRKKAKSLKLKGIGSKGIDRFNIYAHGGSHDRAREILELITTSTTSTTSTTIWFKRIKKNLSFLKVSFYIQSKLKLLFTVRMKVKGNNEPGWVKGEK